FYAQMRDQVKHGLPADLADPALKVADGLVAAIGVSQTGNRVVLQATKPTGGDELLAKAGGQVPALASLSGPGQPPPLKPANREQAIAWVREHNALGPDHQIVKDTQNKLAQEAHHFLVTLGANLVKSGKATWLLGWRGRFYVFELTPEQS